MIPNREGLFNAYPAEVGVDETGPNKLATCIIKFHLYEELQASGEWADCAADNFEITGYFYLEKKDGSLNTITIDALKAALDWDGRDPFWLQEQNLSSHAVQLKLAMEEYNGKRRMKVQYLNPLGSTGTGGVTKAEGPAKTAIRNRLGSKLRALAGPAQASFPLKLPPAKPKTQPPSPPPEASFSAPQANMEIAWTAFCEAYEKLGPNGTPEDREQQWFVTINKLFPGKPVDDLSAAEWGQMATQGPCEIVPF